MTLKLVTPPSGEIVTVAQAKVFLRVTNSDDDELIGELITTARQMIEGQVGHLNALFLTQTWDLILDSFAHAGHHHHHHWDGGDTHVQHSGHGEIMIPLAPVQSIVQVSYYDETGVLQVVDPANYYLDSTSRPPWLLAVADFDWPATLAAANTVSIRFVGGYAGGVESESGANNPIADNVPAAVKLAVKMLVQDWYDNRRIVDANTLQELPYRVERLLQPFRMFL